ncbi:hypothetical protein APR12_003634 [Nocardia amikacinitolerans]|uniref:hypothetical protein n=1 Tax=Nocardia amikacinitolerans TaxID=756689 RepID=UPI00082B616F|nr:hypothetical protein [Nocardia amikacinitolerans]MCP2318281.1 hypothetical protein [Nocardia amikacinitolerans]
MIASRIAAIAMIIGALLTAGSGTADAYGPWSCAPDNPWQPTAELFGTWNNATITDPADPRMDDPLTQFELEVDLTAVMEAGLPVSSEPVDGVHWSEQSQQITYEPARRFEFACTGRDNLCWIADDLRVRYNQQAVLGIEYLPADDERADGFLVRVPGVDLIGVHDALMADPVARERIGGGWVTADGTLIFIADRADLDVARAFIEGLGAHWDPAAVRYGDRQLVTGYRFPGVYF